MLKLRCWDCGIKLKRRAKRCISCKKVHTLNKKLARVCHSAVNLALLRGEMIKPNKCAQCDNIPVNAHHSDYSDPYKVEWLCKPHHTETHIQLQSYDWRVS